MSLTAEQLGALPEWLRLDAARHREKVMERSGDHVCWKDYGDWPCREYTQYAALADDLLRLRTIAEKSADCPDCTPDPTDFCPVCGKKACIFEYPDPHPDGPDMSCLNGHWWSRKDAEAALAARRAAQEAAAKGTPINAPIVGRMVRPPLEIGDD